MRGHERQGDSEALLELLPTGKVHFNDSEASRPIRLELAFTCAFTRAVLRYTLESQIQYDVHKPQSFAQASKLVRATCSCIL